MALWNVPEMWPGATVYILGGGPSLADVDVERLRGQHVIAVNNAYKLGRWIPVMYFMDCKWFEWHGEDLAGWPGLRVMSCHKCKDISWLKYLEAGHRTELDNRPSRLTRGTNGGFGAMALAIKFGATRIILFGFDMKQLGGKDNWHEPHPRGTPKNIYGSQFIKSFESVKGELAARGIKVINATPGSALHTFPIVSPEEVYP